MLTESFGCFQFSIPDVKILLLVPPGPPAVPVDVVVVVIVGRWKG